MSMSGDVKVPGVGSVPKKYAIAGVGVVAVAAGVFYWRKRNAPTPAATADGPINPATGYVEGTPEDLAAMAQLNAAGGTGGGGTFEPGPIPTTNPGQYTYPTGSFASNDAWAQAARDYLTQNLDLAPGPVGTAIGLYLSGGYATPAQKAVIEQAEAFVGKPPIPGVNGYPPSIREAAAPPPTATKKQLAAPHLTLGQHRAGFAALSWTAVPGTLRYSLHRNGLPITTPKVGRATTVHVDGNYEVFAIAKAPDITSPPSNVVRVNV